MAHYLITGGTGFIGSHIARAAVKAGHTVRVLDRADTAKRLGLKKISRSIEVIRGDIRERKTAQKACKDIDVVFHLAALTSVPGSLVQPHLYNDVNINGTLNMLMAAVDRGVGRFIFSSSAAVYGDAAARKLSESTPVSILSPYALTKLAGEHYCRVFSKNFGLETVCLRYFNVFGPGQSPDDEYALVIPKFIQCLKRGQMPPVFGDGGQTRDFVYIDNVVSANLLAARKSGIKHEVFNVASGRSVSIRSLVKTLNRVMRKNIQPKFLPGRPGDIYHSAADIRKIQKILGYKVLVNLADGLARVTSPF